jgi:hypothetical protein
MPTSTESHALASAASTRADLESALLAPPEPTGTDLSAPPPMAALMDTSSIPSQDNASPPPPHAVTTQLGTAPPALAVQATV